MTANLCPGDLPPNITGPRPAEVNLRLHDGLHMLHVVVEHWDGYHTDQGGRRRDGNTEEGQPKRNSSIQCGVPTSSEPAPPFPVGGGLPCPPSLKKS